MTESSNMQLRWAQLLFETKATLQCDSWTLFMIDMPSTRPTMRTRLTPFLGALLKEAIHFSMWSEQNRIDRRLE